MLVVVVILLLPSVARTEQAAAPKRILVLYWYNREFPGNVTFDANFQAALQSAPAGTVDYYSEYLESNRFPGENQSLLLRDYLRQKYADYPVDVIVAVTDAPLNFLLKYRDELFTNTPIVFVAVNHPAAPQLASGPGMTGITQGSEYRKTLSLALKLHPDTEQVFIVSGTLDRDKEYETRCQQEFQGYESRVSLTYLTDLSPDELILKTKSLPERSILLYVFQQSKNDQGKVLETRDNLDLIVQSTRVPIYGLSSWKVGRGIVGGYVRIIEANGTRAAEIALRIANGERAQDIPVESTPVVPMFDWRELRRWGIRESLLPTESVIEFRVPSFWDQYKWRAIAMISVVITQSLLIAGLLINRTRRKRAEQERVRAQFEVAQSQARLAGVIGSAMDAIISIDERQRIVLFNAAAQKMFGCAEREAIGQPIDRFIPERFRQAHHQHVRTFGETSVTKRSMGSPGSIYGCRVDGEEFPIEASISQLELYGQKFYTVILRDITERHQAVAALRESEARFRNMADKAPVMIWVSGVDKLFTYFNQQWLDFTGRTMEQELGNGWFEGIHPEDYERCLETYNTAFDRRQPFTMEYRLRRADGQFRWVLDTSTARFSPGDRFLGYIGSCIDITERKTAEEALENLSGRLISARENERARIARELHDDLNQRMALISIELEQLEHGRLGTGARLRERLQAIKQQAAEVSREIHRISYDLHPSKLIQLGLVAAVESVCNDLQSSHELNIEFSHEGVPVGLRQDISLCLYRIVQECLNNIIKHSGAEEAKVELRGTENEVRLRVSDSGIGFDYESPRITKGLGLVGMRERLRLVGGQISIASRAPHGTQINVSVPLGRTSVDYEDHSPDEKMHAAPS